MSLVVRWAHTGRHREQMQVMVAQQAGGRGPKTGECFQGLDRGGAAVDQVSEHIEPVPRGREVDFGEQALERVTAALQVAKQIVHACIVAAAIPRGSGNAHRQADLLGSRPLCFVCANWLCRWLALSMDTALVLFLIVLNGLFAMSEMALTASRKARLQVMVEGGESGAQAAMDLHENPTKFLSTVQIGITDQGAERYRGRCRVLGAAVQVGCKDLLACTPAATEIASTALVVVIITLLTIVFGELVPKRIGQLYPETVAPWWRRR